MKTLRSAIFAAFLGLALVLAGCSSQGDSGISTAQEDTTSGLRADSGQDAGFQSFVLGSQGAGTINYGGLSDNGTVTGGAIQGENGSLVGRVEATFDGEDVVFEIDEGSYTSTASSEGTEGRESLNFRILPPGAGEHLFGGISGAPWDASDGTTMDGRMSIKDQPDDFFVVFSDLAVSVAPATATVPVGSGYESEGTLVCLPPNTQPNADSIALPPAEWKIDPLSGPERTFPAFSGYMITGTRALVEMKLEPGAEISVSCRFSDNADWSPPISGYCTAELKCRYESL